MPIVERHLGIMANESGENAFPPFGERPFYEQLCAIGSSYGLKVFVFSPVRLNPQEQTVRGYTYHFGTGSWAEQSFPLPDLIYDRSFFFRREDYRRHREAVRLLRSIRSIPYLGYGLKSKWEMLGFLKRDPDLQPYLPKTARLEAPEQAAKWLDRLEKVFLKPEAGSQGKGVLMAQRLEKGYRIRARDGQNRSLIREFSQRDALAGWLRSFMGGRKYLIQQYLELHAAQDAAWDIRALVQKNSQGLWELTGTAVRLGTPGSITSNIHGGGTACETEAFLENQFGSAKASLICEKLRFLANRIPVALEASNGRMAELGLDLGIDRSGRIWIIEVNTKPGRSVFRRLNRKEAAQKADSNPVAYAHYLLTRTGIASKAGARAAQPLIQLP